MPTIKKKPSEFKKNYFEQLAWAENRCIIGVDEVGRGCLAGPVVVAATMLFVNKTSRLIKDSKDMNAEEREKAYRWILKNSISTTAIIDHKLIDKHNIYQATLLGMKRAVSQLLTQLKTPPHCIVVDAMPLTLQCFAGDIYHFIYGESKSTSIAAASIIAKVTRDRIMTELSNSIPGYGFESHKGYAIPGHKAKIRELGATIIHRNSFIDHISDDFDTNMSLFEVPENPEIELS
jgi:ribonuclease HII